MAARTHLPHRRRASTGEAGEGAARRSRADVNVEAASSALTRGPSVGFAATSPPAMGRMILREDLS